MMPEHPMLFSAPMVRAILDGTKTQTRRIVKPRYCGEMPSETLEDLELRGSPYGQPGDRLWVRESGWEPPFLTTRMLRDGADTWPRYIYDADDDDSAWCIEHGWMRRPSIHMPRWASRITLEITGVRIERLQDISRGDAMAEGCPFPNMAHGDNPRHWYAELWDSINGPGSWDANPWVWVIEFKRI